MSSLMHDKRLSGLLKKIPVFADATNISVLTGGLTNSNYRVDTQTNSYVMRMSDHSAPMLGIDRDNERINTQRAWLAGVGAELIYSLPEENVLVIRWIEAKTLHAELILEQPELLVKIAHSLRKLHTGPIFHRGFYFPFVRKKYLETVLTNNYFLPDEYLQMEILIKELEAILALNPEELVPCNNDLLAENFMDDGEKIWIIDYEYSGQNEPSFEIGNLASEIFMNDEQLTIFCDAYWQKHIPGKICRAMAWSIIARFGWVMWASIQEGVSQINFDFRTWGLKKWDAVLTELKGARYQEITENLKKHN
jgi:thiamine kinase-like enzyme